MLKQVDLPHSYYWRELYIPQLTSGPSSVAFTPDGKGLAYSMAGSIWGQAIGSDEAVELTHPRGAYDYQPDITPDGRIMVFSRYNGSSIELWALDLEDGGEVQLTSGGAVNVEPRVSPDGKRIAWVSTKGTGHFNLFVADLHWTDLRNERPLLGERRSRIPRYYYSAFDHALNPSWSPDGKRILYVTNNEVAWGTGDIWSVAVDNPRDRRKVLSEETSWSARPETSPDGKQILFASYHGRQWRQLWLTTPDGAAPLPLTFGEFDRSNARWSPDGQRIAYISNAHGNTSLVVQRFRRRRADADHGKPAAIQECAGATDARHPRRTRPQRSCTCRRSRQRRKGGRARLRLDARRRWLRPRAAIERNPLLPLPFAMHARGARGKHRNLGAARLSLFALAAECEARRGTDRNIAGEASAQRASGVIREMAKRRSARPHELRRDLPEHLRKIWRGRHRPRIWTRSTTSSSTRRSGFRTSAISVPIPIPRAATIR